MSNGRKRSGVVDAVVSAAAQRLESKTVMDGVLGLLALDGVTPGLELSGGETLTVADAGVTDLGAGPVQAVSFELSVGSVWAVNGLAADSFDVGGRVLRVDLSLFQNGSPLLSGVDHDEFMIRGSQTNEDQLFIDLHGINFLPADVGSNGSGGLIFDGGGSANQDSLTILAAPINAAASNLNIEADVEVRHVGSAAGAVDLASLGRIAFQASERLSLDVGSGSLQVQLPAGEDSLVLSSGATVADGILHLHSQTSAFADTRLTAPSASLTLADAGGEKTLFVEGVDDGYHADLVLRDDAARDNGIVFQRMPTNVGDGRITVEGRQVEIDAALAAAGGVTIRTASAIHSTADGSIRTTAIQPNADAGDVDFLAGGDIYLAGSIDTRRVDSDTGESGDISLRTLNGSIETVSGARLLADAARIGGPGLQRLEGGRITIQANVAALAFDASASVDLASDSLNLPSHGFSDGDLVAYRVGRENSAMAIGGISDGESYSVIRVDANTIQLADTQTPVVPSNLTAVGVGDQHTLSLLRTVSVSDDAVNSSDGAIILPNHGFISGDRVVYSGVATAGVPALSGLNAGHTYSVIVRDNDTIQLAEVSTPDVPLAISGSGTNGEHTFAPAAIVSLGDDVLTSSERPDQKRIDVTSEGNIHLGSTIDAGGGSVVIGSHLSTVQSLPAGVVSTISLSGENSSGDILVFAESDLELETIVSSSATGPDPSVRHAGTIEIRSNGGQITVGRIEAVGETGGRGGRIDLDAGPDEHITLSGNISSRGGSAVGVGPDRAGGEIILHNPVVLANDIVVEAGSGVVQFADTIDADNVANDRRLTVNNTGRTFFDGRIGTAESLHLLATDTTGIEPAWPTIVGASTIVSKFVDFSDPVLLRNDVSVQSSDQIWFRNSVATEFGLAPVSLNIEAATTRFGDGVGDDRVGGGTSLENLHVSGGATSGTVFFDINDSGADVSTRTTLEITADVILHEDTELASALGPVRIGGTVDSDDEGLRNFAITTAGNAFLHDVVGSMAPLNNFSIVARGPLALENSVTTLADLMVTIFDTDAESDDLTVSGTSTVITSGGNILLSVGDDVLVENGTRLVANEVHIAVDASVRDADAGVGSIVDLAGSFETPVVNIIAGDDDDRILGSNTRDLIEGELGDDYIMGRGGADVLRGGRGSDHFVWNGGDGADDVFGDAGSNDTLTMTAGDTDDTMFVEPATVVSGVLGDDGIPGAEVQIRGNMPAAYVVEAGGLTTLVINSGDGDDIVDASRLPAGHIAAIELHGGSGDDTLLGSGGTDQIFGDDGNDVVDGNLGDDLLLGGDGHDQIDFVVGTSQLDDFLEFFLTEPNPHIIEELPPAETLERLINATGGNDRIHGGPGHDLITGGFGNDRIHGGSGSDFINGDATVVEVGTVVHTVSGADIIYGGDGADLVNGGLGPDFVAGGRGDDIIYGSRSSDLWPSRTLNPDNRPPRRDLTSLNLEDADHLFGGAWFDSPDGFDFGATPLSRPENVEDFTGSGNDRINGNGGADLVDGGDGVDAIFSIGGGNDILFDLDAEQDYLEYDQDFDSVIEMRLRSVEADDASTLYDLDMEYGLEFSGDYHLNWGGRNEKWIAGDGSNWFFITPDGTLHRWIRGAFDQSTVIGYLDESIYANPALLYLSSEYTQVAVPEVNQVDAIELAADLGLKHYPGDNVYLNWAGLNEKWLSGSDDQHFYITPSGALHRWNGGTAEQSTWVADLSSVYYQNPTRLVTQGLAYSLDRQLQISTSESAWEDWGGWGERWLRTDANQWVFVVETGDAYLWQGGGMNRSKWLGKLDESVYEDLSLLADAFD